MSTDQKSVYSDHAVLYSTRLDAAKKRLHIEIKDEVTSSTVPELRCAIRQILDEAKPEKWNALFLDMRASRLVDSMGINWLFAESARVKDAKKEMVVRISSPAINRVMQFAGLDKLVTLKFRRRKQTR